MSLLKKIRRYSVFCLLASLFAASPLSAKTFSKENLEELALNFIKDQIPDAGGNKHQLNVLSLDSRIPDRACEAAPAITTPTEPPFNRQVTVQIQCEDLVGWSQYVHVRIVELVPVLVATENLTRGEVIQSQHLNIEMKPKQFVRPQNLQNKELLIGSRSKRNIRSGFAVSMSQICMVCKGDNVTIYANIKGLAIKTSGIALQDGTLGEQVKVKNKKSGKVLDARVNGVEAVEVNI